MKTLTPTQLQALKALARRKRNQTDWFAECFPAQRKFLEDPAPLKAALCTRRAGKSFGVGVLLNKVAEDNPGVSLGCIGLTRDSIKKIYFKDIMAVLARKHGVNWKVNKTELSMEHPNGAIIYFAGADASEEEMNKFLGQKYKLVVVDESSMYTNINLRSLVYDVLEPAVADYRGQIILIGTPSNYLNSLYFDVTNGLEPGWSVHKWTVHDNPHMVDQAKEFLERARLRNPKIEQDAGYRQHWLGEWVVDLGARVYKYDRSVNTNSVVITKQYQFVLGIDLGYEDDTAFVVGAWSHYDMVLHIVHCESAKHLNLDQVEMRIKKLQAMYNIGIITVDGAAKQFVETLQTRFKMGLQPAEKHGKKDFIELMNTDFVMGRINVLHDNCLPLVNEYNNLIWDEKKREQGIWKESSNCSNHAADAALYMWRWCYNFAHIPKNPPPTEEEIMEQKHLDSTRKQDSDEPSFNFSDSDFNFGF